MVSKYLIYLTDKMIIALYIYTNLDPNKVQCDSMSSTTNILLDRRPTSGRTRRPPVWRAAVPAAPAALKNVVQHIFPKQI